MQAWMEDYKRRNLTDKSSVSKWLILQSDRGLYYKKELDNIDFNHKPVGFTLYPYEIANDLIGILNDIYNIEFKWEEVCDNEATHKIKYPANPFNIYYKFGNDGNAKVWVDSKHKWMSSNIHNEDLDDSKVFLIRDKKHV